MKRVFVAITVCLLTAFSIFGQETPLWIRKNSISPDGKNIAFSYKGDIYTVQTEGGKALQITTNNSYDSNPIWTKDNKSIVFSSNREGSNDIYITSAQGGEAKRLTFSPSSEIPQAVLSDGSIIYSTYFQEDYLYDGYPGDYSQLFITNQNGKKPTLVTSLPIAKLNVNNEGTVLYEDFKGYEDPFRKHHTSSVTRDIWVYKNEQPGTFGISGKGSFKKLTTYKGEDREPIFDKDGDTFYYLSEQNGTTLNIFKSSISSPENPIQLTYYDKDPVRYISVAENGTIAYSQNGELYVIKQGEKPQKVKINIIRDEAEKEMFKLNFSSGASSMAISPEEKEIAVVIRGDVFVTSTEYRTTKRITNTAEQERDVCFSKDGRELYYSAERDGFWGIYKASLIEKNDKLFTYSNKIKEELFSNEGETSFQPLVSPDGKWVAYLRDRTELVIKSTKGGKTKSLLKDTNYSYIDGDQSFQWSPDSQFLLCNYQGNGGWNNEDVAAINIETGEITNITQSGYSDGNFSWALGGKAMVWQSDKYGYRSHGSWGAERDIYIMFFDGKAMTEFNMDKEDKEIAKLLSGESDKKAEKKEEKKDSTDKKEPKKLNLDFENRFDRIKRLTKTSSYYGGYYLSNDGTKLYYITPLESGRGLCELDLKEGTVKVLSRNVRGEITPSSDGKSIYIFSGSGINKVTLAGGNTTKITFSGDYEFKPKAERTYIFNHIWKQVKEKFYLPDLHKVDWEYYKNNYSRFLPYINNYYDFQEMLSEMLGELNGSHTGARFYGRGSESIGHLGIIPDYEYEGDGIKIKEVLPNGSINIADSEIKTGDVICSIEGIKINAGDNWIKLLINKAGKKIEIGVKKGGKKEKYLYVKPSSSDRQLLYKRWVRNREKTVEKLSGGRVGYVHVQGMNSDSFREVFSKALGKYRNCEALIVDTRHNGGGWLHDDLASFLNGKAYIHYKPREKYIGTDPHNKWTKLSCVLICEDNYSDASGFPYVYKTLGIGKLIGTPVPGTMTAVWWENQINASIIFGIPKVGAFGLKENRFLENLQIEPDILVYNEPSNILNGEDKQLEAAINEMLKTIDNK